MSGNRVQQRLTGISEAIAAITSHLERGDLSDGLIFDAVRIRLLEIGEAVKALPPDGRPPSRTLPGPRSRACEITSRIGTSTPATP